MSTNRVLRRSKTRTGAVRSSTSPLLRPVSRGGCGLFPSRAACIGFSCWSHVPSDSFRAGVDHWSRSNDVLLPPAPVNVTTDDKAGRRFFDGAPYCSTTKVSPARVTVYYPLWGRMCNQHCLLGTTRQHLFRLCFRDVIAPRPEGCNWNAASDSKKRYSVDRALLAVQHPSCSPSVAGSTQFIGTLAVSRDEYRGYVNSGQHRNRLFQSTACYAEVACANRDVDLGCAVYQPVTRFVIAMDIAKQEKPGHVIDRRVSVRCRATDSAALPNVGDGPR